jgi:putative GTP pyrophosphokinase
MKGVDLRYSKSQIDKAGEVLKKEKLDITEMEASMEVLSNWRAYHAMPLDTFAKVLKERVKRIDSKETAIVAQRLKRTPSILLKLRRHSTMRLSAMQDIGGLRAIFENLDDVYRLVKLYRVSKSRHELFDLHDYIATPKADGYRSVHLIYKLNRTPKIFLEIQVRSYFQHIWATGVEVFGTLTNSSFKSGFGARKWLDFFALLSSVFAVKENSPLVETHRSYGKKELLSKARKMIRELQVVKQLLTYTAIYKITSAETKKIIKGRRGNYSLILLNSHDNTTSFSTFSSDQIEEAINKYTQMEKEFYNDINMNVVLVSTGDVHKLEKSYPNYFMDTKILVEQLSLILEGDYI